MADIAKEACQIRQIRQIRQVVLFYLDGIVHLHIATITVGSTLK
jgi:hypothetical protein